ncbi:MAG: type II secretion system protein GspK [Pirellulaceae bacterium]|nr:type II secretion system protein GspK [Pirellulaceae bacterium]
MRVLPTDKRKGAFRRPYAKPREGFVLILVLVMITILSLLAYTYADWSVTENEAGKISSRQVQARLLTDSGIDYLKLYLRDRYLDESEGIINDEEEDPLKNSPDIMQGIAVTQEDSSQSARFTILHAAEDSFNEQVLNYGLQNESAKLNLNLLLVADSREENGGRNLLLNLPGMTEEAADSIMDWIDPDDEPREFGAEIDYYGSLEIPYQPPNGNLTSIEEMLLIEGVTPQLLFGKDINRNGRIDTFEESQQAQELFDYLDSEVTYNEENSLGWAAYLTLHSFEKNVNSAGEPRVNLNNEDLEELYDQIIEATFDEELATFVVAYRQNGPFDESGDSASGPAEGELDFTQAAEHTFEQVLDLANLKTKVRFQDEDEDSVLDSPINEITLALFLGDILDKFTTVDDEKIIGRININEAPRTVLLGIPGADEELVDLVLSERENLDQGLLDLNTGDSIAWLYAQGLVTLDQLKEFVPYITAEGSVFKTQIVGFFDDGVGYHRVILVLDRSEELPRILSLQNVTHLGRGFSLDELGAISTQGY